MMRSRWTFFAAFGLAAILAAQGGPVTSLAGPGGAEPAVAGAPEEELPLLEGPYLGQKPPGMVPEIFAPGIVSTENSEGCHGFMLDGRLFLYKSGPPGADWKYQQVRMLHMENGKWQSLGSGHLHGVYPYNFTVSPDGRTLYLSSIRKPDGQGRVPQDGSGELLRRANIWKIDITDQGWAPPELIPEPISTDGPDAYPTVTGDGTLYFMSVREGGLGEDDIYRSRLEDGKYVHVEHLGPPINTEYAEVDLFVAPDESYLIFCSDRPGGHGKFDLYITHARPDGSWSEPANMGKGINTAGYEFRPAVTPDGKYFFFTRAAGEGGEDALYWVDSKILATFMAAPVTAGAGPGQAHADSGTFRDPRDGQVYPWVRLGDQIWMAENLRFATESGSWCWENDAAECRSRGRFYDWETAQGVAPPGWHLPTDEEWKVLERALGLTADQIEETGIDRGGPANTVAAALKKAGAWPTEYEGNPIEITNETHFSALPSGLFGLGEFSHDGYTGWWTSTASGDRAWIRFVRFFDNKLSRDLNNKAHAFPVRCLKDDVR